MKEIINMKLKTKNKSKRFYDKKIQKQSIPAG